MAFYTPLLANAGYDIVMLKATSSAETDGNGSEQDGSVRVETSGGKVKSLWSHTVSSVIIDALDGDASGVGIGQSSTIVKQAFTFTPSSTLNLNSIYLQEVGIQGTPIDNVKVSVQTDSSGDPSGTELDSTIIDNSDWPDPGPLTITFAGKPALTGSTAYWIVFERTGSIDAAHFHRISGETSGTLVTKTFNATSWVAQSVEISALVLSTDIVSIYVATQQETRGRVALHTFDTGTDTWTTKNEFVVESGGGGDFDNAPDFAGVAFAVRTDGSVVLGFVGNDDTNGNDELFYIIRTAGVWGNVASLRATTFDKDGLIAVGPSDLDLITFAWRIREVIILKLVQFQFRMLQLGPE